MVGKFKTTVNGLLEMAGYSSRVAMVNGRQLLSAEYPSVIEEGDAVNPGLQLELRVFPQYGRMFMTKN